MTDVGHIALPSAQRVVDLANPLRGNGSAEREGRPPSPDGHRGPTDLAFRLGRKIHTQQATQVHERRHGGERPACSPRPTNAGGGWGVSFRLSSLTGRQEPTPHTHTHPGQATLPRSLLRHTHTHGLARSACDTHTLSLNRRAFCTTPPPPKLLHLSILYNLRRGTFTTHTHYLSLSSRPLQRLLWDSVRVSLLPPLSCPRLPAAAVQGNAGCRVPQQPARSALLSKISINARERTHAECIDRVELYIGDCLGYLRRAQHRPNACYSLLHEAAGRPTRKAREYQRS
jgi:hypothetical protein